MQIACRSYIYNRKPIFNNSNEVNLSTIPADFSFNKDVLTIQYDGTKIKVVTKNIKS